MIYKTKIGLQTLHIFIYQKNTTVAEINPLKIWLILNTNSIQYGNLPLKRIQILLDIGFWIKRLKSRLSWGSGLLVLLF